MGTLTLPKLVLLAGAALCAVAGYLLGSAGAPDTAALTTATVTGLNPGTGRICLRGEAVKVLQGVDGHGVLCGTWRRAPGQSAVRGAAFRFVVVRGAGGAEVYGSTLRRGGR